MTPDFKEVIARVVAELLVYFYTDASPTADHRLISEVGPIAVGGKPKRKS
jgi:hypothetical protein